MLFNGSSSVAEQLTTFGTYGQTLYSQQHEGAERDKFSQLRFHAGAL